MQNVFIGIGWLITRVGKLKKRNNEAGSEVIKRSSYHPYGGLIYEIKKRGSDGKCEICTGPLSGGICRVKIGFLPIMSTAV